MNALQTQTVLKERIQQMMFKVKHLSVHKARAQVKKLEDKNLKETSLILEETRLIVTISQRID